MKTKTLHVIKLMMLTTFTILVYSISQAQTNKFPSTGAVGIGTISPNASSLLEIKSTSKGFLPPRMTLAQRNAIVSPATGLLIYQTDNTPGFYYYNGGWKAVTSGTTCWSLTGNAGTNSTTNFIGTTDAKSLVFKVNNQRAGLIDYSTYNSGTRNTAFGEIALNSNTSGIENTATGYGALLLNTIGSNNSAYGKYTLYNNNANDNTALGYNAMFFNTTGTQNTATGSVALQNNTTSSNNTADGYAALYSNNGGNENTAVGVSSLYSNISGSNNTATGFAALNQNTASNNTANGFKALYSNTNGALNTAVGVTALYANTTGSSNTAIGLEALHFNTTGGFNTASGVDALLSNTEGSSNTATGYGALLSNIQGSSNTANGVSALSNNTTGFQNTAVGSNALYSNTEGYNNVANGLQALWFNGVGHDNTATGTQALFYNSGNYNTSVGFQALFNNTSGFNNTGLGIGADVNSGNLFNATAIGANAIVNASNKIRLGDGGTTVVESSAGSWTVSDGRFKNNIKENVKGLEFINLLRPVTYNFDTKKFQEFLLQNSPDSIKSKRMASMDKDAMAKASGIVQTGFIAQEVAEAVKKSGYSFNGVHAPDNTTDNWSLSYEKLVVPLVKAVQELSAKNNELQQQINELKAMMQQGSTNSTSLNTSSFTTLIGASLEQNNPNPFNNTTTISYTLPQKFISAQIIITDKAGKTLKQINISGIGRGMVNIDAATLAAGTYNYSLVVDGKLIGTRQMILAK